MRERFSVPRPRRGLLIAAIALLLALGGATAGLILSLGTASADGRALASARFPGYQLSFHYPSTWHRVDWCWSGTTMFPVTLLTTADAVPPCQAPTALAAGTPFPPPQLLGSDGVAVWWASAAGRALVGVRPNARVGGEPARITVQRGERSGVTCVGKSAATRVLRAQIRGPSSTVPQIQVGAVICGPDLASGEADVHRMLESVRFTG